MPSTSSHAEVLRISKNPRREVSKRLDVTFADENYEIDETQTTHNCEGSANRHPKSFSFFIYSMLSAGSISGYACKHQLR